MFDTSDEIAMRIAIKEGIEMAKTALHFIETVAEGGNDDELYKAGQSLNDKVRDFRHRAIKAGFKIV